jgi:hypothetical protein
MVSLNVVRSPCWLVQRVVACAVCCLFCFVLLLHCTVLVRLSSLEILVQNRRENRNWKMPAKDSRLLLVIDRNAWELNHSFEQVAGRGRVQLIPEECLYVHQLGAPPSRADELALTVLRRFDNTRLLCSLSLSLSLSFSQHIHPRPFTQESLYARATPSSSITRSRCIRWWRWISRPRDLRCAP